MLKKQFRVTSDRDIKKVYKKGLFKSGKLLKVNVLSNRRDFSRVAVVTSKKIEKRATRRNKVKRVTREAVKEIYSKIGKGYDIIINVKGEALGAKLVDIKSDLTSILKKLKVIE